MSVTNDRCEHAHDIAACVAPGRRIAPHLQVEVVFSDVRRVALNAALGVPPDATLALAVTRLYCGARARALQPVPDRPELRCSLDDLLDVAPHPVNIEQEANEFAMTLLMPADDAPALIAARPPSIALVRELSERYGTSLVAAALRVRELSTGALCLVYVAAGRGKWCWPTSRFQWR